MHLRKKNNTVVIVSVVFFVIIVIVLIMVGISLQYSNSKSSDDEPDTNDKKIENKNSMSSTTDVNNNNKYVKTGTTSIAGSLDANTTSKECINGFMTGFIFRNNASTVEIEDIGISCSNGEASTLSSTGSNEGQFVITATSGINKIKAFRNSNNISGIITNDNMKLAAGSFKSDMSPSTLTCPTNEIFIGMNKNTQNDAVKGLQFICGKVNVN